MARAKVVPDEELFDALVEVFREHGFEGASLSMISAATGLGRASLYHRFPGGKEEMAAAVLERVHARFGSEILAPLAGKGDPARRVKQMAGRLAAFYEEGRRSCLLDTLSLGVPTPAMKKTLSASIAACLNAFAGVAREAGATPSSARRRAELALTRLQGALVLARGTGAREPFRRVIRALPELLLEG